MCSRARAKVSGILGLGMCSRARAKVSGILRLGMCSRARAKVSGILGLGMCSRSWDSSKYPEIKVFQYQSCTVKSHSH